MSLRPTPAPTDTARAVAPSSSLRIDALLHIGQLHLEATTGKLTQEELEWVRQRHGSRWWDHPDADKRRAEAKDAKRDPDRPADLKRENASSYEAMKKAAIEKKAEEDKEKRNAAKEKARTKPPAATAAASGNKKFYIISIGGDDYTTMRKKVGKDYFLNLRRPDPAWDEYNDLKVELTLRPDRETRMQALTRHGWELNPPTTNSPHIRVNPFYDPYDEDEDDRIRAMRELVDQELFMTFGQQKANAVIVLLARNYNKNWGQSNIVIEWDVWKHTTPAVRAFFVERTKATHIHLMINDVMRIEGRDNNIDDSIFYNHP